MTNDKASFDWEAMWRHPRAKWIAITALVAAVVVAYGNSLSGPFVLDDGASILDNRSLRSMATAWFPPSEAGVGGRPLLNVSFAMNHALGRLEPRGYHLANLAIHVGATLLVFALVRRTLAGARLAAEFGASARPIAAMTALIWALHPLQTESVTYVSQRAESLAGLCLLATLYCFVRSVDSPHARAWRIGSVAACLGGMGVKETMVVAPIVVLLYDWFFVARGAREELRTRWPYYAGLAASWIWLAWLMVGSQVGQRLSGGEPVPSILHYAFLSCGAIVRYLRLTCWPAGLVVDYGAAPDLGGWAHGSDVVAVGVLLVAGVLAARRWPIVGFLVSWFAVLLAPTTSVVPIAGQPVAEHRMYLALLAPVAWVVAPLVRRGGRRAFLGLAVVALGAGAATWMRNRDYRSAERIWTDTVTKAPRNARAWDHLGVVLVQSLRFAEAKRAFEIGLNVRPDSGLLHLQLGNVLGRLGETERAMELLGRAAVLLPANPAARNAYAVALATRGQFDAALRQFEEAFRHNPDHPMLHSNICDVLRRLGRLPEAIQHGQKAVQLAPWNFGAHGNLAMALLAAGRVEEAVGHHREWLRLQPGYAGISYEFAVALMQLRRLPEAQAELEDMLSRNPDDAETHNLLGIVLGELGQRARARREFERALQLAPGIKTARENLEQLLAMPEATAAPAVPSRP